MILSIMTRLFIINYIIIAEYHLNNTYQAVRLPTEDEEFYLGKSINGMYCACASLFQGHNFRFGCLTTNVFMEDKMGVEA